MYSTIDIFYNLYKYNELYPTTQISNWSVYLASSIELSVIDCIYIYVKNDNYKIPLATSQM